MAYPALGASTGRGLAVAAGAAAVVVFVAALAFRVALLVPVALALSAGAYGVLVAFRSESSLDVWAPVVATALVLASELASWTIDLGGPPEDRRLTGRRLLDLASLAAVSAAAGTLLLAVSVGGFGGGLAVIGIGAAAAAGTVAVIAALARRFVE